MSGERRWGCVWDVCGICVVTALCCSHSYAPWCPACESLQPEWEKFAEWGEDLGVNVAKVDVTEQPGEKGWEGLRNTPGIWGAEGFGGAHLQCVRVGGKLTGVIKVFCPSLPKAV